jgi:hypothetical protein
MLDLAEISMIGLDATTPENRKPPNTEFHGN